MSEDAAVLEPPLSVLERFVLGLRVAVLGLAVVGLPVLALPPVLARVEHLLARSPTTAAAADEPADPSENRVWIIRDDP